MIYLDYAKSMANGYILNFFADAEEDIASVSNGKHFITKNGTDYGVPLPSSTIVITMPDKTKKTYILNEAGEWQLGGGETDYSKLTNVPIILANLADKEFIPEANTYYEHLGETTEDFTKGIIYLYDGKEYKAIDGSGSSGIQSDYNQNDSTAPDYIKNRPFYEELVEGEVVYEKTFTPTEVTLEETHKFYQFVDNDTDFELKAGDIYEVTFNGIKYLDSIFAFNSTMTFDSVGYMRLEGGVEPSADANPFALLGFDLSSVSSETPVSAKINVVTLNANEATISIKKLFLGSSLYSTNNLTFTDVGESGSMAVVTYKDGLPDEMYLTMGAEGEQINQFDKVSIYNFTKNNVDYVVRVWGNAAPCQAYIDQHFDGLIKFKNTDEFFGVVMAAASDGNNFGTITIMGAGASGGSVELFSVSRTTEKINYIDPKFIKDMYYTKPEGSVGKVLVFKGEINGVAENIPNVFEKGDMVSLKEPEAQLDVSVIAKYHKISDENSFAYIGNLSLFDMIEGAPDTKEDYLLICGYETDNENKSSVLIYTNKKHDSPNNIEVYKGEDSIVRIPEKYMPENVALKSYVDDAISNAITKTLNTEV